MPGVTVTLENGAYRGDVLHEDAERPMTITLKSAMLNGAIRGAALTLDEGSRWSATANPDVRLAAAPSPGRIDAPAGVVIIATMRGVGDGNLPVARRRHDNGAIRAVMMRQSDRRTAQIHKRVAGKTYDKPRSKGRSPR